MPTDLFGNNVTFNGTLEASEKDALLTLGTIAGINALIITQVKVTYARNSSTIRSLNKAGRYKVLGFPSGQLSFGGILCTADDYDKFISAFSAKPAAGSTTIGGTVSLTFNPGHTSSAADMQTSKLSVSLSGVVMEQLELSTSSQQADGIIYHQGSFALSFTGMAKV